jgi:hypothetical protein
MEIKIKSPRGVKLLTEQKYCIENIDVVPELQNKTVTPSDTQQVVTPDANYAGLGSVTVEPGTVTADATATANDIRLGKTAYGATGKMTGTIADYDGSSEPTSGKSLFAQLVNRSITEVTTDDLKGITDIGSYAFYSCSNLMSITIPDHVRHAYSNAFADCYKLTSISIPNSMTEIAYSMFSNCVKLTNITIGNGVSIIYNNAFAACSSNTELGGTYTILTTIPPTLGSNTFNGAKINKIIVPVGTSATYKAATNWSALADKIEEATE